MPAPPRPTLRFDLVLGIRDAFSADEIGFVEVGDVYIRKMDDMENIVYKAD